MADVPKHYRIDQPELGHWEWYAEGSLVDYGHAHDACAGAEDHRAAVVESSPEVAALRATVIYVIMQNDFPVAATRYGEYEAEELCNKLEAEAVAEVRRNYPERARYCPNNLAGYWRVYKFEDALAEESP